MSEFNFVSPSLTEEEVNEAVAKSAPRTLATPGKYRVRLHSMKGRTYTKDGQEREMANLFFINLDGNYKGAELTLFRVGGDPSKTTSQSAVIAIAQAAGLDAAQIRELNWALGDEVIDERGNKAAAFGTAELGPISVEGLEFVATIDIEKNEKTGYERNVVKYLNAAPKSE